MPGEVQGTDATQQAAQLAPGQRPPVSDEDKALSADWLKRIEAALARPCIKESFAKFEQNRKLLRGIDTRTDKKMRANLYFANLAMMRPQVYAKDPEYSIEPTKGVPESQLAAVRSFAETGEALLHQVLVKDCKLKKRAKRLLTSAYATSIGWWKLCWQDGERKQDPIIANRLKDTQDNIERLQQLRQTMEDPAAGSNADLQLAQLRETLAGLETQAEVTVARGLALDFVLSEDILIIDPSVRELGDYERAGAIGHRVWMTREKYKASFGYDCAKGKGYTEKTGQMTASNSTGQDKDKDLLCVWEVWDQDSNRVFHVCEGEEGFCDAPMSPDWTGQRWYPFFGVAWNEIDGTFYPLSDVELTQPLIEEYNDARDDLVRDRKDALPFTVIRKGGSLTEKDAENIRNRKGNDVFMVEGVGGQDIKNDIQAVTLGTIKAENYNTQPARADMEMIIGGGDAARGSVMQAKTATEAEIVSQGLRGRSAERQDTVEDLLAEVGEYALQIMLRKMSQEEVRRIAGPEAFWPQLNTDDIFEAVSVEVRAGSTGKPDRLQEQDRWTKLQPVIKETVMTVAELYAKGQVQLGQALVEMLRETLRRFDERIDVDQYLPKAPEEGQQDPAMLTQQNAELKAKVQELMQALDEAKDENEKALIGAYAQIATSDQPASALVVFQTAMQSGNPEQLGAMAQQEQQEAVQEAQSQEQPTEAAEYQPQPM